MLSTYLFFKKLETTGRTIEKILLPFIILLGILMVVVVSYGVFTRYVLNNPPRWTEELARYLMIWMALLATSICQRRDEHVYITFIIERLPRFLQKTLSILAKLAILFFFYIVFSQGIELVLNARQQVSTSMGISMLYPLSIIPIAALINMSQVFLQVLLEFRPSGYILEIEREKRERRMARQIRTKKR